MLKETFDKASKLDKSISLMTYMRKKILDTNSINELFRSELISGYGNELNELKEEIWAIINSRLERLQIEFESL